MNSRTVVTKLQETEDRINELEADIEETQANLDQAEKDAQDQYAALKVRIRQMYEQGDTSLMEIILQADDISSILNSSAYIAKISEYDNNLLEQLKETVQKIEQYKTDLENQKSEQEQVKAEQEEKKAELDLILEQKHQELESLGLDIESVDGDLCEIASSIDDTEELIAAIEEQERKAAEEAKKREEEAKKQQEQQQNNNSSSNSGSSTGNNSNSGSNSTGSGNSNSGSTGSNSGSTGSSGSGTVTGSFLWPTTSSTVTSGFGGRTSPGGIGSTNHQGIDIGASAGSPIYAADGGTVVQAGWQVARGNYIVVSHGNGLHTLYQHCSALYASVGQTVSKGQTIAAVGSTGYSTGPHLHFEVWVNYVPVNPLNYL